VVRALILSLLPCLLPGGKKAPPDLGKTLQEKGHVRR